MNSCVVQVMMLELQDKYFFLARFKSVLAKERVTQKSDRERQIEIQRGRNIDERGMKNRENTEREQVKFVVTGMTDKNKDRKKEKIIYSNGDDR